MYTHTRRKSQGGIIFSKHLSSPIVHRQESECFPHLPLCLLSCYIKVKNRIKFLELQTLCVQIALFPGLKSFAYETATGGRNFVASYIQILGPKTRLVCSSDGINSTVDLKYGSQMLHIKLYCVEQSSD